MKTKAAVYCRALTSDQKTDMQLIEFRKYANNRGFTILNEYIDNGLSGSIKQRPGGAILF